MPASTRPAASLSRQLSCRAMLAPLLVALTGCAGIANAPQRFGTDANALQGVDAFFASTLSNYLAAEASKRKEIRNLFIETRAALIDQAYAGFRQTLYDQRVGMNVGIDLATLGLNAVGTVTGSEPAKTALHALSGGLIGSKASIDKNVFFDRTMPAMLAQMESQRSTMRLRLLAGMMEDPERYPLMQARADLEEYYVVGTLIGAIGGITTQAMVEQKVRADELANVLPSGKDIEKRLRAQGFNANKASNDNTSRSLLQCVSLEDAALSDANETVIQAWLKANIPALEASVTGFTKFLNQAEFSDARQRAVDDPGLRSQLKGCALATPNTIQGSSP